MPDENKSFMVEDAEIIFRNFEGREGPYNKKGERSFGVVLTDEVAAQMLNDGWNVKFLEPREEGDSPRPFISVAARFDKYPPRVVLITSSSRTQLDEGSVEVLDWTNFKTVDLIARGSYWEVNGKSGWKAYLQSMFVTIEEDALERKYGINELPPNHGS
jgi:hypothetical protein